MKKIISTGLALLLLHVVAFACFQDFSIAYTKAKNVFDSEVSYCKNTHHILDQAHNSDSYVDCMVNAHAKFYGAKEIAIERFENCID